VVICCCQNSSFGDFLLESDLVEADREAAKESRTETFAKLFAGQAEIFYCVSGQLFQIKGVRNEKIFQS